jgi:hypothetical protein
MSLLLLSSDINLSHVSMWQPSDAIALFVDCEKSLPIRHLDVNVARLPFAVWFVVEFVKTLLSKKIRQRIHTIGDEAKLRQKFDPAILPAEFGGGAGSLVDLGRAWRMELVANRDRLKQLDQMLVLGKEEEANVLEARKAIRPGKNSWLW